MTNTTSSNCADKCCPPFEPEQYDEKEFEWNNKLFVKEKVRSFLYMPLTMSFATTRVINKIKDADAMPSDQDYLLLDDFASPWGSSIYMFTTKDIPGAVKISGRFVAKVYEGPYYNCGKWVKDMKAHVKEKKGREPTQIYAHYTTCPKCAKERGKNYVVILAKVGDE